MEYEPSTSTDLLDAYDSAQWLYEAIAADEGIQTQDTSDGSVPVNSHDSSDPQCIALEPLSSHYGSEPYVNLHEGEGAKSISVINEDMELNSTNARSKIVFNTKFADSANQTYSSNVYDTQGSF